MLARIERTAIDNNAQKSGEAREALAGVLEYEPRVRACYQDAEVVLKQPDEVIESC